MTDGSNRTGLTLAVVGAILFALRPVLVKLIYVYDIAPVTVMTWRMGFALPFYIAILVYLNLKTTTSAATSRTILLAAAVGILGYYCAALFDLYGLQFVTAQLGRIVLYTYPTMVTLLGWWWFRYKVTGRTWLALLVSYVGVTLIFVHDVNLYGQTIMVGTGWILLSALFFSLYLLFSRPLIAQLGSMRFTCLAMISASAAILVHFLVHFLVKGAAEPVPPPPALALIFVMSIASTLLPSFLISGAIQRIGSSSTSIAGSFGPAMTAGFAVLLLGERFTLFHLAGTALVVAAITLSARQPSGAARN